MARNRKIPAPSPEGLVDVPGACHLLDVSKPTLYRYAKDSDFPRPVKHLGRTWWKRSDLEAWRAARTGVMAGSREQPDKG